LVQLIQTVPAFTRGAMSSARLMFSLQMLAASPYRVLFASSIASSGVRNVISTTTGPKISTCAIVAAGCTVGEERRRIEETVCGTAPGRLPEGGTLFPAFRDQRLDPLELDRRHDGPDVDRLVEGIAHAKGFHPRLEPGHQLFGDAFLREDARTGAADLALVEPDRVDDALHHAVEVGVIEDEKRRLSAQLERELLPAPAVATRIARPTSVDPVNAILSTPACATSAAPVRPSPVRMFTTPSGSPASRQISPNRSAVSEVNSAGLSTTVFPIASAGAIFHASMRRGKFHGMIWPTTPTGTAPGKFAFHQLRPAGVVIEMARDERDVDVARFADRLPVVQRLEHREEAALLLDVPRDRIEVARPRVSTDRLPARLRRAGSAHRGVHVRRRSLRDAGEPLTVGRDCWTRTNPRARVARSRPPMKVTELPRVRIEPRVARDLRLGRGPHDMSSNSSGMLGILASGKAASCELQAAGSSCQRMTNGTRSIVPRAAYSSCRAMSASSELAPNGKRSGRRPAIAELFLDHGEPVERLFRRADATGRL
jgi:hypothetical protein